MHVHFAMGAEKTVMVFPLEHEGGVTTDQSENLRGDVGTEVERERRGAGTTGLRQVPIDRITRKKFNTDRAYKILLTKDFGRYMELHPLTGVRGTGLLHLHGFLSGGCGGPKEPNARLKINSI